MNSLLLIDDDVELCHLLREYLQAEDYQITLAHTATEGIELCCSRPFDLLILDVMLPDLSGLDLLPKIRQIKTTPILMLTARGDEIDRIIGLELGADDYLSKPCNPRELLARIKSILRRSRITARSSQKNLMMGELKVQTTTRSVYCYSEERKLTGTEYNLLVELMNSPNELIKRETLSQNILGRRLSAFDRSIDMHVSNLRKKLSLGETGLPNIKTIRGAGYILCMTETPSL